MSRRGGNDGEKNLESMTDLGKEMELRLSIKIRKRCKVVTKNQGGGKRLKRIQTKT